MDIYAENILEHWKNPRMNGLLQKATVEHGEENIACGDTLRLSLILKNGIITNIGWTGEGCAISQASMSLLCEELVGKTVEEILALTKEDVYALLGVPIGPRRFKCALMSLHVAKNALKKANGLALQGWIDTVGAE